MKIIRLFTSWSLVDFGNQDAFMPDTQIVFLATEPM